MVVTNTIIRTHSRIIIVTIIGQLSNCNVRYSNRMPYILVARFHTPCRDTTVGPMTVNWIQSHPQKFAYECIPSNYQLLSSEKWRRTNAVRLLFYCCLFTQLGVYVVVVVVIISMCIMLISHGISMFYNSHIIAIREKSRERTHPRTCVCKQYLHPPILCCTYVQWILFSSID